MKKQGLSKTALKVLDKTDRLIKFYRDNMPDQNYISLYKADYDALASSLKKNGQNIEEVTYSGFYFVRHNPVA